MSDYTENSPICRRIPLTVNSGILRFVYPDRPSEFIWNQEDLPHFCLGETVIFCFTFLDDSLQPVSFQKNDFFELAADADFIHGDDPLMLFAGPENVNLAGDWQEADPARGKISIRVNCNTVGFEQKIGTAEKLVIRMEVRRFAGDFQTVLLGDKAVARNSVHTNEGLPENAGPEYYSAFQIDQIIDEFESQNNDAHESMEQEIGETANVLLNVQQTADAAANNAVAAQNTADEAVTNAAAAQSTADEAKNNAATAQSTADEAKNNAATAQSTADEAKTNAATAQSTADEAKTNAATAQSTAEQAQSDANSASMSVRAVSRVANTAQAAAETAQAAAETAQAAAETAQNTADCKLTAPAATGTAGQVLTLGTDGTTPEWADAPGDITFNAAEFAGTDEIKLNTNSANRYGSTTSNTVDYVKERWMAQDGSTWYRLWASGWLEQGGTVQGYAYNNENRFFTFPKEFAYDDYICTGSCATTEDTSQYTRTVYFGAKTTTSVAVATGVNGSTAISQMTNVYFAGWSA